MPTTKKRINLTIPDVVYRRIEAYKIANGISSDAAACTQLIVRQLDGMDNAEKMMKMVMRFTPDELRQVTDLGLQQMQRIKENNTTED